MINKVGVKMKKIGRAVIVLVLLFGLSACWRPLSAPTVDLSLFTPHPENTGDNPSEGEAAVSSAVPSPSQETSSITPTPTPELSLNTEETLRLFPLHVGSAWVYDYLGFDENIEANWHVIETVVQTRIVDGYYAAQIQRSVELISGDPPPNFSQSPQSGVFWYLIDRNRVFLFDADLSTDLSNAWLDLILPFPPESEIWYPDPIKRANPDANFVFDRYASAPYQKLLPTGVTHTCYNITSIFDDELEEATFCEGVGFVFGESKPNITRSGYYFELLAFTLQ